ncbi:hypothetical protein MAR_011840, partial [Mya arenaria]
HFTFSSALLHCTGSRKYFFLIRKCGRACDICEPPRLDLSVFNKLHDMPDPEPRLDEPTTRFRPFQELCVYAPKKFTADQRVSLELLKEDVIYTCGGTMFPEDREMFDCTLVQPLVTCSAPVCNHYYSIRSSFRAVSLCYNCGSSDLHEISTELKAMYQSVHPVCVSCHEKNIKERTGGIK